MKFLKGCSTGSLTPRVYMEDAARRLCVLYNADPQSWKTLYGFRSRGECRLASGPTQHYVSIVLNSSAVPA